MEKRTYQSITRGFSNLGCTQKDVRNLAAKVKNIAGAGSFKDYVNSAVAINKNYTARLFSRTPPWIDMRASDNGMLSRQMAAKFDKYTYARVTRAIRCIRAILSEILYIYDYIELPIGGCGNHTLTPTSDLDIQIITSCPSAGRNQLATIAIVVGLVEVCQDIPCGSTLSVRSIDDFLTAQSIDQQSTKTAIICSVPPCMLKKQKPFYDNFLTKAYEKIHKVTQGRTTLNDYYCDSLRDYGEEIQRKVYSSERVRLKDFLKVLTLKLHLHMAEERGLNLLRGKKFSELFFDATRNNPLLENIHEVLGSVLRKAKTDPDKEMLSYMISKEITMFSDIVEGNGSWFS